MSSLAALQWSCSSSGIIMSPFHSQRGAGLRGLSRLKGLSSSRFLGSSGAASPPKVFNTSYTDAWKCNAMIKDAERVDPQSVEPTDGAIPVLSLLEIADRLQSRTKAQSEPFRAMYSSVVDAITLDPAAMVIPLDDHMIHRGHGVFDTAIIYNGHLYELDAHLDRLLGSAAMAKIKPPFDRATLRHILVHTVAASGCRQGSLRYWLSAGVGGFGLSTSECYESTFYAIVFEKMYLGPEGVKVVTSTIPIKHPMFAAVKSVNYLPNALAQLEAEEMGAFTAIWLDHEGFIAEGPNMNVAFFTNEGWLLIPPFDNVLAGCTARRMLELIQELVDEKVVPGFVGVKIQRITLQEAKAAVEMMLIGSGVLVKPVTEWDGQHIGNGCAGSLTLAIRKVMQKDLENPASGMLVSVPYNDGS